MVNRTIPMFPTSDNAVFEATGPGWALLEQRGIVGKAATGIESRSAFMSLASSTDELGPMNKVTASVKTASGTITDLVLTVYGSVDTVVWEALSGGTVTNQAVTQAIDAGGYAYVRGVVTTKSTADSTFDLTLYAYRG